MNYANLYLIIIITSILYLSGNSIIKSSSKEHFLGPIISPLKAVGNFASNFPTLIGVLVEAFLNFAMNFVDIFLSFIDIFTWIINVPMWCIEGFMFLLTSITDLFILAILWLNPITMIKSIIKLIVFMIKLIFGAIFNLFTGIGSFFIERILNGVRGGLWGIPHGPDQHIEHDDVNTVGRKIKRSHLGLYGHHHGDPHLGDDSASKQIYQPMRCYKGIGANGFINIVALIICPPLGVFMSYGLRGFLKILICSGLSLLYYFPGLIYGLLITTHLGIGRELDTTDCGGEFGGFIIKGCPKRTSETDCNEAVIPNKITSDGNAMKACLWHPDETHPTKGRCRNVHIRYDDYDKMKSGSITNNLDIKGKDHGKKDDTFNKFGHTTNEYNRYGWVAGGGGDAKEKSAKHLIDYDTELKINEYKKQLRKENIPEEEIYKRVRNKYKRKYRNKWPDGTTRRKIKKIN